jgi:hypothetical protein
MIFGSLRKDKDEKYIDIWLASVKELYLAIDAYGYGMLSLAV